MNKSPAILRLPVREREKPMAEQVARGLGGFVLVEIGRARKQLMPIGQDPSRHQGRIPKRTESEHQINAFNQEAHGRVPEVVPEVADRSLARWSSSSVMK
jgi:hypothetical protein